LEAEKEKEEDDGGGGTKTLCGEPQEFFVIELSC